MAETSPNGKDYDYFENGYYFKHLNASSTSLVDADYIEDFIVPESADGRIVTTIPNKAFAERIDIESVTLSTGLTLIDNGFVACEYLKKLTIPANSKVNLKSAFQKTALEEVSVPAGVTMSFAFTGCISLQKAKIDGVANINYSFVDCTALKEVELKGEMEILTGFEGCTSLETITLPASLKVVDGYAFKNCTSLKEVIFEDAMKIEKIGVEAFMNTAITKMPKFENLTTLNGSCFAYTPITEFYIPEKINQSSLDHRFSGCTKLEKLTYETLETACRISPILDHDYDIYIGESPLESLSITSSMNLVNAHFAHVRTLKHVKFENSTTKKTYNSTFCYCKNLESVEIGAGTELGWKVFDECPNLRTVTVSEKNKATSMENNVFSGCTSLESISFPEVTSIGEGCFEGCSSLKSINFPKLKSIGYSAFMDCVSLEVVNLPEAESINDNSFKGCTSLKSVDMAKYTGDNGGGSIFSGCTALTSANLPMMTKVPYLFFFGCEALESVNLGENVEISQEAFCNCKALTSFDFSKVIKLTSGAFNGSGIAEAILGPSTVLYGFPFTDCPSLKKVIIWNDGTTFEVDKLPALEYLEIKGNTPYFSMRRCMSQNAGTLIFNGDVDRIAAMTECENLQNIVFNGKIGTLQSSSNWTLFRYTNNIQRITVSDINNWLSCKFVGEGSAPAWEAPIGSCDFYVGNEKLTHLHVPAGINIPGCSFTNTTIEELTIEGGHFSNPISIGDYAFQHCTSLKKVNFNGEVTSIGAYAFDNTRMETMELPNSVTYIGDGAFERMANIRSLTLSEGLTNIPNGLTYNCPSLEKLIIPEGVKTLGYQITDVRNTSMKLISLPSTLEVVSSNYFRDAFENLSKDVEVWCWASVPPQGARKVFGGNTVHVPYGCGEAYRTNSLWYEAVIVDDAETAHDCTVTGTTITITVPMNNIHDLGQVAKYVVKLYIDDELVATYEFDSNGEQLKIAARGTQNRAFNIDGLNENTKYDYVVNGYTETNDLITKYSGTVTTGKTSGVNTITADEDIEAVYNIQGQMMPCVDNLPGGVYILKHSNGKIEKRVIR